jgi:type II secretory pathway pseudopilin PulG
MTLLEIMITIVIVAVASTVLFRMSADSFLTERKVKRLMAAGHAIESAIERERIRIAADPGKAPTPTAAAVAGNFPPISKVWNDTDIVNSIVVVCSTGMAVDLEGNNLANVRTLKARAEIYADKGGVAGLVLDTLTIYTAVSRFF